MHIIFFNQKYDNFAQAVLKTDGLTVIGVFVDVRAIFFLVFLQQFG